MFIFLVFFFNFRVLFSAILLTFVSPRIYDLSTGAKMVRYQNSQLDSDVGRSQASNQNDYFVDLGGLKICQYFVSSNAGPSFQSNRACCLPFEPP